MNIVSHVVSHSNSERLDITVNWRADFYPDFKGVVFTYGSLYEKSSANLKYGFGGGYLIDQRYIVCSILDSLKLWYQNLDLSFVDDIEIMLNKLQIGSLKRYAYGSSMGAFAALLFSPMMKVDVVLAISPQFSIWESWDKTWEQYGLNVKNPLLPSRERYSSGITSVFIVVDPMHRDYLHTIEYKKIINSDCLKVIEIFYSGHPASSLLAEIGKLKDVVNIVFSGSDVDLKIPKNLLHSSATYRFNLAVELRRKKKKNLALRLLNSATISTGGDGIKFEIYRLICILKKELGHDDLHETIRESIVNFPGHKNVFIKFLS